MAQIPQFYPLFIGMNEAIVLGISWNLIHDSGMSTPHQSYAFTSAHLRALQFLEVKQLSMSIS